MGTLGRDGYNWMESVGTGNRTEGVVEEREIG